MNLHKNSVLILHLSDIHFNRDSTFPNEKIKRMVDLIDPDVYYLEILIFVTGDVAFGGTKDEYEQFKNMATELEEACKPFAKQVTILIVPGNHDISLSEDRKFDTVNERIADIGRESAYYEDCESMIPFFELVKEYGLFLESQASCAVHRNYGDELKGLDICLFNTAPFSLLEKADKELHYLPPDALKLLSDKDENNIKMVLMHHSTDWFVDENANQLNGLLDEYVDLVFVGHEHDGHKEIRERKGKSTILMRAGETHPDVFFSSEIRLVEIDLKSLECIESRQRWDKDSKQFLEQEVNDFAMEIKRPHWMKPLSDFTDSFNPKIPGIGLSLEQVYVFPSLRVDIGTKEQDVDTHSVENEKDFWNLLQNKRVISIAGASNYGKTSLLTHLYLSSLDRGYLPLFLTKERKRKSLRFLINSLIREQYGDSDRSVNQYRQYPKEKEIIFIDDFDLLNKKEDDAVLINSLLEDFGTVVFSVNHMINEGVAETIKANLGMDYTMTSLRIKDFYIDKRRQLIELICSLKGKTADETDEIRNIMEMAVSRHRGLYDLSPDFIIMSVQYYLSHGVVERQEEVSYNHIFESSITKQLETAIGRDYGNDIHHAVSECLVLLGEIAAFMHSRRNEFISFEEASKLIHSYNQTHMLYSDPGKVIKAVIDAEIMEYEENPANERTEITFSKDTYLAYFVAKWLDLEQRKKRDISHYIDDIVRGLCFKINENILLFLAYLRSEIQFPIDFCNAAYEAIGSTEVFSFDRGTIRFLSRWQPKSDIRMALPSEKKSMEKKMAAVEESTAEDILLSHKGPYEYTDEDCLSQINRIDRAIKCLRLVGKSLVSLNEVLEVPAKELIVETLFEVPNRILYEMFHELDSDFDHIVEDIHRFFCENDPDFNASIDDIKGQIYLISLAICLFLYDQIAYDGSTRGTINSFLEFKKSDTNTRIQTLCMISCARNLNEFIDYAINAMDLAKRNKNMVEIVCIRIIVNHYLMQHSGIPNSVLQRCSEKIFTEKDRKKLLINNRAAKS